MQLHNLTPLPATAFRQFDRQGALDCVVAARGRFRLRLGAPMAAHPRQPELQWADAYEGDPHASCLLRSTDLAPHKPGTDVSFLGDSFAPGGEPASSWLAGIRIGDRLDRWLRVTGPRRWVPRTSLVRTSLLGLTREERLDGWDLSEPEPATSVPMDWRHAAGGPSLGSPDDEPRPHPDNPLGPGVLDERRAAWDRSWPAAQIEPTDAPLAASRAAAAPAGFGLVPPWWPCRLRHAGAYDAVWRESRHPLLPEDFDDRFWQAAAPGMVVEPWLEGGAPFTLTNLHPVHAELSGFLPRIRMVVRVHRPGAAAEDRELALDGVQFDLREGGAECHLTWRTHFPLPEAARAAMSLRATDMQYRRLPRSPVQVAA